MTTNTGNHCPADTEEAEYKFESVLAMIILIAAAALIIYKWPPAAFTIALTPTLGGPVGLGLCYGIFWLTRQVIIILLSPSKDPTDQPNPSEEDSP